VAATATLVDLPAPSTGDFHPIYSGRWTPEPLRDDGSRFATMGFAAAAWINANTKIRLDPWQIELLRRAFLYYPVVVDGDLVGFDWMVRDILVVGPEGLGKSAFFAGIGLWLLEGPCLPPDDRPGPHPMPDIPVVSAALSLTRNVHRFARSHVKDGPLDGRVQVENTKIFRSDDEAHRLWFPAGSGAYQQGGGPTTILEEELHVANAAGVKVDGVETIEVISSKRSKKAYPGALKVQRFTITNPDDGDEHSLLGRRWQHAERVLRGIVEDPELLAIHFHAALPWDLDDPADLRRGLLQAMPSSFADIEAIAAKYEKDRQSPGWFMRYSGGLFHAADDQVFDEGVLEARAAHPRKRRPPKKGTDRIALAFDGARNRDSVCLYGFTEKGFGWTHNKWERPAGAKGEGWRYPKFQIALAVEEAMDVTYPTAYLAVDPTWFEDFVLDGWHDENGDFHEPWAERWAERIVLDVQKEGSEAWTVYRQDVMDGAITHDGDTDLYRHMRNAREKLNRYGRRPVLTKKSFDGKHPIDILVTATYANRLRKNLPEPPQDPVIR
jgi:hypothetical protein